MYRNMIRLSVTQVEGFPLYFGDEFEDFYDKMVIATEASLIKTNLKAITSYLSR